jgi:urease subunit beta
MIPGEYILSSEPVICNPNRKTVKITVKNTGDRPCQVGSHTHFFEVNKALDFPREKSYGYRLNIPANGLTMGGVKSSVGRNAAMQRARERGFRGA